MDQTLTRPLALSTPIKHLPLKRIFDVIFSLLVLTLGSPIFLILALAVKITSKGKVIYGHERIGRGGKKFLCYKFRTMYTDADKRLSRLLISFPKLRREWETNYKLKKDPRVTVVGRFLRRTSLDELPQFWNILKGDMSVVGPRPITSQELDEQVKGEAPHFLRIRPGLTGPWQVAGRSNLTYAERIEIDLEYIDHHSLMWDLVIILKTIPAVCLARGAY